MTVKQSAWVVVGVVTMVVMAPGRAQAAGMMFGKDEKIHVIQSTNDPEFNLCYKTTIFFFVAGCYVTDDGYVLQKKGDTKKYIPLTPAAIEQLQKQGASVYPKIKL
jgi:hypothetical protein